VCHSIQDRTLEYQFFELIINPASLRPIAEDRLETEDLSSALVFAGCQIFASLRGGMAAFAPCTLERVVAFPLIVGAVGADLFDLSGRVLKQIRQGFGISDIVRAGHDANDFQRRFIIARGRPMYFLAAESRNIYDGVLLILIVVTATRSVALHHGKWFVSQ
jgi:hypothetical protein